MDRRNQLQVSQLSIKEASIYKLRVNMTSPALLLKMRHKISRLKTSTNKYNKLSNGENFPLFCNKMEASFELRNKWWEMCTAIHSEISNAFCATQTKTTNIKICNPQRLILLDSFAFGHEGR